MRVVEHRPVACAPSGDVLRCLPISGLQTPLGAQTGSLCSAYAGLPPQAADVHPRIKNHANVLGNLNMTTLFSRLIVMPRALVVAAWVLPVIALALPDDATLSQLWLEHGTVIDMRPYVALTGPGSWIRRTKAITPVENGGLNRSG